MGMDLDDPQSSLKILVMRRAKIIATASNKIEELKRLLIEEDLVNSKHNLFYTAAKIERDDDGFELRMVQKIVNILSLLNLHIFLVISCFQYFL